MLEIKEVGIVFGGLVALDKVNMTVNKGDIYGLIGPNGSGKTTLINVITGFYVPTSGEVLFNGQVISGKAPHQISHAGLGRTFQNINLFPEMTALENVVTAHCVKTKYNMGDAIFQTKAYKAQEAEAREKAISQLEFVGLKDDLNIKAKNLPYGKRRLLEMQQKGDRKSTLDMVLRDIKERDERDMNREIAPLKRAADAYLLDTSDLTIEESIAAMKEIIEKRLQKC